MRDQGLVVACDVRARRVSLLHRTIRGAGPHAVRLVHVPTTGGLPFRASFDRVLVDAPCSGLGTIRRDPDLRWRRTEGDLRPLAAQQLTLLQRAADTVGAGGRLVYATCSSEPDENEAVVDAFLSAQRDFDLVDLRAEHVPVLAPFVDDRGFLRTLPFEHQLEAFFAAAMLRRS
jgi:16S rRNA (cytosine967-C5)-methyltransferase